MNSDIRVSTSFFFHRKTKKLRKRLGDHGVVCLMRLWSRVAIERPSGIMSRWTVEDIEIEADFEGEPGTFVKELVDIGFIDVVEDEYHLHNWDVHQPWVADANTRSISASKNVLFRHVSKLIPDKELTHFREWYNSEYKHEKGNNSNIVIELYEAYTKRIRSVENGIRGEYSFPSPSPSPEPVKHNTTARSCGDATASELEEPANDIKPVLEIPLIKKDGFFRVTQEDINTWQETYPGVDVLAELKKIRQWNIDNPKRRKTKAGVRKHISYWLDKAQNRSSVSDVSGQGRHPPTIQPCTVRDAQTLMNDEIARRLNAKAGEKTGNTGTGSRNNPLLEHQV